MPACTRTCLCKLAWLAWFVGRRQSIFVRDVKVSLVGQIISSDVARGRRWFCLVLYTVLSIICTRYHMATRALANLSPEGDKLDKRPRGHVITGLLQFKLLCRIIIERTRPTFLWISANAFLFGRNRRNAKARCIQSNLSVKNDVFQTAQTGH